MSVIGHAIPDLVSLDKHLDRPHGLLIKLDYVTAFKMGVYK